MVVVNLFCNLLLYSTGFAYGPSCDSLFRQESHLNTQDFPNRDDQFVFGRLYSEKDQAFLKKHQHLSELFSVKEYLNWKRADANLMAIPIGQFKISRELIEKTHSLLSPDEFSEMKNTFLVDQIKLPPQLVAHLSKLYHQLFEGHFSVQRAFQPMNEENFQDLKKNNWIDQVVELPWPLSRESSRRAVIVYSSSEQRIQQKLDQLIKWYEEQKERLDPVELASLFQRKLVSIHPYIDGNGRLSRLFMDRILHENHLESPLLKNFDEDLFSSEKVWVQTIRERIQLTTLLKAQVVSRLDKSSAVVNGPSSVKLPFKGKISEVFKKTFIAGNELFYLGEDGLIYSSKNIPYLIEKNKLYPVSESTYFLLGSETQSEKKHFLKKFHISVLREHIRFFRHIEDKAEIKDIEVVPYEVIREKNNRGDIHFYPFMRPLLEEIVLDIENSKDPLKSVSSVKTRYDLKSVQSSTQKSKEGVISNRISQYQKVVWELQEISRSAMAMAPDLAARVDSQILRIHREGAPYFSKIRMQIANFEQSRLHPQIEILKIFIDLLQLDNPNASHEVLKKRVLARVDLPLKVSSEGFSANQNLIEWLRSSPFMNNFLEKFQDFYFSKWLKFAKPFQTEKVLVPQLHPDSPLPARFAFQDRPMAKAVGMAEFFFRALITQITANNYRYRDDSVEFDRMYFYGLMHAQDYYTKSMISATASPYYLIPNSFAAKTLKFAFLNSFKLYVFTTDQSNLYFNSGSDWYNTYEFLLRDGHQIKIEKSFKTNELLDRAHIQSEQFEWLEENKNIEF